MQNLDAVKHGTTDVPVEEIFLRRWSPRAFGKQAVADRDLKAAFSAGGWAASCSNEQPWRILVGRRAIQHGRESWKRSSLRTRHGRVLLPCFTLRLLSVHSPSTISLIVSHSTMLEQLRHKLLFRLLRSGCTCTAWSASILKSFALLSRCQTTSSQWLAGRSATAVILTIFQIV